MVRNVESFQLAAFLHGLPGLAVQRAWERAFPEQELQAFQSTTPGVATAQGNIGGNEIHLVQQGPRLDVIVRGAQLVPTAAGAGIINIDQAVSIAKLGLSRLVPDLQVARMAAVIQAPTLTASADEALAVMRDAVPGVVFPDGTIEANYQVVVAAPSGVSHGRVLTQLCRWQTVQMQLLEFQVGVAAPRPTSVQHGMLTYIDVFGTSSEAHTADTAVAHLDEVVDRAFIILSGGFNAI